MIKLYDEDTIVAIATPPGKAGVGIVRISGNKCCDIANKIIKDNFQFEPNYMYLRQLFIGDICDIGYVVYFKTPKTFTGEDIIEIQAHGGYFLLQEIVKQAIVFGARMATPGEFSKRAFLNGKITIDQAEGIADLINSESYAEAKISSESLNGSLGQSISEYQNQLLNILANLETKLDYPEYEFEGEEISDIRCSLNIVLKGLESLYNTHPRGKLIKNGVRVAVIGRPNVGKSSLLNRLCGEEKAIVTDIAGTTRDIIEADFEYKGIIFHLFDTAGLRDSEDIIEKIGIDKAKKQVQSSDLILSLREFNSTPVEIIDNADIPIIQIVNKIDITNASNTQGKEIYISALKDINIDILKEKMFEKVLDKGYDLETLYLTNERHIECVRKAIKDLIKAVDGFDKVTLDFVISDIKSAWQNLGEITGKTSSEDIIDEIFSKFCLGK